MTTILLICSVALNIVLLVWAVVIWRSRDSVTRERPYGHDINTGD